MPPEPGVSVVVVTWQGAHLLPECLDSLAAQTVAHEVLVVDNASTDATAEVLLGYPGVRVLRTERNLGFAGGADLGLRAAGTEFVALLNNDAVAEPTWLAELLAEITVHPRVAAVTSLLLLAGTDPPVVNNAGVVVLPSLYGADRAAGADPATVAEPAEVFGFSGGAALLRRSAALSVGGFPVPFFLYYEDTDLSWRLRLAGWSIRYRPTAVVRHRHAATSDRGSRMFSFYNERNRLLTVARCAPPAAAAAAWGRFCLTTASLTVRHALRRRGQEPWNHRVALRLHVLASALRLLPWAVAGRLRAERAAGVTVDLRSGS